jgi:hypothetical protein
VLGRERGDADLAEGECSAKALDAGPFMIVGGAKLAR